MTKRTGGPWVVTEDVFNYRPEIRDRDGRLIAVVMAHYPMSATTQSANAAFIVRACNCHDELVEALKAASVFIRNGIELGFIRMPDKDTPDPAYLVPGMIETALAKTKEAGEIAEPSIKELDTLHRIRKAVGDTGKMMQDELVDKIQEIVSENATLRKRLEEMERMEGR